MCRLNCRSALSGTYSVPDFTCLVTREIAEMKERSLKHSFTVLQKTEFHFVARSDVASKPLRVVLREEELNI